MDDDRIHDDIVEHIADVISEQEIHISNQSVERQLLNGAFDGLSITQSENADWMEYLASCESYREVTLPDDEMLWDYESTDGDEIPDGCDVLDRWGDLKVAR